MKPLTYKKMARYVHLNSKITAIQAQTDRNPGF